MNPAHSCAPPRSAFRKILRPVAIPCLRGVAVLRHKLAERVPFSWLLRKAGGGPLVLMYHAVSDAPLPHIAHLYRVKTAKEFEEDLDFLLRTFRPAALGELSAFLRGEGPRPERAFYLTFDDGLRSMSETVAPLLLRKGLPATFFVSSGFLEQKDMSFRFKASLLIEAVRQRPPAPAALREIERLWRESGLPWSGVPAADFKAADYGRRQALDRAAEAIGVDFREYLHAGRPYLTAEEVRGLAQRGFTLGSHSVDHPRYADLDLAGQLRQTREGARDLAAAAGVDHKLFAFPFSEQGAGKEFYRQLMEDGTVDLFFGTSGWQHRAETHLIQRVSLEGDKPEAPVFLRHSMMDAAILSGSEVRER